MPGVAESTDAIFSVKIEGCASESGVTYYEIAVTDGSQLWRTKRRYRDFACLHESLQKAVQLPPMPRKSFFWRTFSGDFRAHRMEKLDDLVHVAVKADPHLQSFPSLRSFLDVAVPCVPCFDDVLCKVYSMAGAVFCTMLVTRTSTVSDLKQCVTRETGIRSSEMKLLLAHSMLSNAAAQPLTELESPVSLNLVRIDSQGPAVRAEAEATQLQRLDYRVRRDAVRKLGHLGQFGALHVARALDDEDSEVRLEACEVLGDELREHAAPFVEQLLAALTDRCSEVRGQAADSLGEIGAERLDSEFAAELAPRLAVALEDESEYVRRQAVKALGKLGVAAAVCTPQVLQFARHDPSTMVRKEAAVALARFGEASAELLRELLQDESWTVRALAVYALGETGRGVAPPLIVEQLVDATRDPSQDVRLEAVRAFGKLGADSLPPQGVLRELLTDDSAEVRAAAAKALHRVGATV